MHLYDTSGNKTDQDPCPEMARFLNGVQEYINNNKQKNIIKKQIPQCVRS